MGGDRARTCSRPSRSAACSSRTFIPITSDSRAGCRSAMTCRCGCRSERTRWRAMMLARRAPPFADAESFFRAHGVTDSRRCCRCSSRSGSAHDERLAARSRSSSRTAKCCRWSAAVDCAGDERSRRGASVSVERRVRASLISGDQVLPTISSNISFTFRSSDTNPLGSYLSSLRAIARAARRHAGAAFARQRRFDGLQQRIDDLTRHHQEQLETRDARLRRTEDGRNCCRSCSAAN